MRKGYNLKQWKLWKRKLTHVCFADSFYLFFDSWTNLISVTIEVVMGFLKTQLPNKHINFNRNGLYKHLYLISKWRPIIFMVFRKLLAFRPIWLDLHFHTFFWHLKICFCTKFFIIFKWNYLKNRGLGQTVPLTFWTFALQTTKIKMKQKKISEKCVTRKQNFPILRVYNFCADSQLLGI